MNSRGSGPAFPPHGDEALRVWFLLFCGASIGIELVQAVDTDDREVRAQFLADGSMGPCRRKVRRAPIHLGNPVFVVGCNTCCGADQVGIAVFISELAPIASEQPLVFLTELLAAIPSIVYGLWGIFVLVPAVRASRCRSEGLQGAAVLQRTA